MNNNNKKASSTSFPDRPQIMTMECGLWRSAFVLWLFFERCSTQGNNEELTHWSSEKVCIPNVGLLFPLLFHLVAAIWERSSFKKRRLGSLLMTVNEERNSLSQVWSVWDLLWKTATGDCLPLSLTATRLGPRLPPRGLLREEHYTNTCVSSGNCYQNTNGQHYWQGTFI